MAEKTTTSDSWWGKKEDEINCANSRFAKFYYGFVIKCPVSIKGSKKGEDVYKPVSARACSFRDRGITSGLLVTINNQIKKKVGEGYYTIDFSEELTVEDKVAKIEEEKKNKNVELIVFKRRANISDTEAVYYGIRNAIAHGSFEIKGQGNKQYYLFESSKNNAVNSRIRLSAKTMNAILSFSRMSKDEILKLRTKVEH